LDPETVAEEIVKAVLRGRSDHILLPRGEGIVAALRGWPSWLQTYMRNDLKKMMRNWKGRQVVQPSEGGEKGKVKEEAERKDVESSGVLV
jgi:hypothetical protein